MLNLESLINDIENDCATEEEALYKLLELAIAVTDHGYMCMKADHIKEINLSMGCVTIGSDTQHQGVCISFDDRGFLMYDKKIIKELSGEIKKRLLEFDKKIKKTRTELADEIFNRSIDHIVDVDEVYDELYDGEDE